ncbi:MAG TPA: chromosome segregation protein SMC, partial [Aestuariivirga sp.]|nr:chromosome segregation protein SMC [Aestuariivirga sp.]
AGTGDGAALLAAVEHAVATAHQAEQAAAHAEVGLRVARQVEGDRRQAHDEARRSADRLVTEVKTLTNLLRSHDGDLWPPLVDQLKVHPGYETALGAALGDDLDASGDEAAPVHWRGLPPLSEVAHLPSDCPALARFVDAPPQLARVLAHVGVVSRAVGAALQAQLKPGQKLVSREGDVWRWDGFTAAADAPSAAAKRLAEKNRLASLEGEMAGALAAAEQAKAEFETQRQAVEQGVKAERDRREDWRSATAALDVARRALAAHERQQAEHMAQTSALDEAQRRSSETLTEARERFGAARDEAATLPALDGPTAEVQELRNRVTGERALYTEARARHDGLEREARARTERRSAIAREREQWQTRAARAKAQIEALEQRAEEARQALAELAAAPAQLAERRNKLMNTLQEAE